MVHLIPLNFTGSSADAVARLCVYTIWRLHGMPLKLISGRDSRFTSSAFRKEVARGNGGAEIPDPTMDQIVLAYTEPIRSEWDLHFSSPRPPPLLPGSPPLRLAV
jgi:hypothetical protein